jgi:hypothetical protein
MGYQLSFDDEIIRVKMLRPPSKELLNEIFGKIKHTICTTNKCSKEHCGILFYSSEHPLNPDPEEFASINRVFLQYKLQCTKIAVLVDKKIKYSIAMVAHTMLRAEGIQLKPFFDQASAEKWLRGH